MSSTVLTKLRYLSGAGRPCQRRFSQGELTCFTFPTTLALRSRNNFPPQRNSLKYVHGDYETIHQTLYPWPFPSLT